MRVFVAIAVCAPLGAAFVPGFGQAPQPLPSRRAPSPAVATHVAAPVAQTGPLAAPTAPTVPASPMPPPTGPSGPLPPTRWTPSPVLTPPSAGARGTRVCRAAPSRETWLAWWNANRWRLSPPRSGTGATPKDLAVLVRRLWKIAANDLHYDPKSAAFIALGKMGPAAVDDTVLERLTDRSADACVRESAILACGMARVRSLAIATVIADPGRPLDDRVHALVGLGLGGGAGAAPLLAAVLRRPEDPAVTCAAFLGAGLLGDAALVEPCRQVLRDRAALEPVRAAAAACLGRLDTGDEAGDRARRLLLRKVALTDSATTVRIAAVLALRELGGDIAIDTVEFVPRHDSAPEGRAIGLVTAAELAYDDDRGNARDRVTATAMRCLAGDGPEVRGCAALALGLLGRRLVEARTTLRAHLGRETDPSVRSACAIALGLARDEGSASLLASLVGNAAATHDERGFACVGLALAARECPSARGFLADVTSLCNVPELKSAAALSLASMGKAGGTRSLLRASLADRNRYYKLTVMVGVGWRGDPAHLPDLWAAYQTETNPEARAFAVVAMGCIADASRIPALRRLANGYTPEVLGAEYPAIARVLALH